LSLLLSGVPTLAQSPHYRVGILTPSSTFNPVLVGLREGLAQLGYQEGKNLTFLVEDAQGQIASLAVRATHLVAANPDLIFTISTAATIAAKQATSTLPIVFTIVSDPLKAGLVASHASSKNNLTGIANHAISFSNKRLELLKEIDPQIKRILIPVSAQERVAQLSYQSLAEAASKLGLELVRRDVTSREEIVQVLQTISPGSVDAMFQLPASLLITNIDLLIQKAKEAKLPLSVADPSMVEQGALLSYGADFRLIGIQSAQHVVKLLQRVKPEEMPIQVPETLLLTLNLTTAQTIGIKLSYSLLERADYLFE
jgi:putative ABC transport system substrate-binding protein